MGSITSAFTPSTQKNTRIRKTPKSSALNDVDVPVSVSSSSSWSGGGGVTRVPIFDDVCTTTGVTLTRFMNEVAMPNPELRELTTIFGAIDTACKAISNQVKRSPLPFSETLGYQGGKNVQGEDQKVRMCLNACTRLIADESWKNVGDGR